MLRARSPLFHFNQPASVIRGAYTGAVRSYLTFSIKLLTFFWLDISLHFSRRCSEMQNLLEVARTTESFAFNTRGALKLCRFSSPAMASLKCSAFLSPTPKRAADP